MNGSASSSFSLVNAEYNSMGRVAEDEIGISDDTSPRKVVIKKVQAALRKKSKARDETKRELEFLEKGGNLLDYRLPYVASASVQSTSVTDLQSDRLVANEAKGSAAFVTSSHGESVETNGGPRVVPSEANSADNLLYFDADTEFSDGGRSLSHPCRSDFVPPKQSLNINETQKHGDSAASNLPRKAYRRRYKTRPSHEGTRSFSMEADRAHGDCETRDAKYLESEGEKQDMKLLVLSSSITPVEAALVKIKNSGERLLNQLDGSKSNESMRNPVQGVSRLTQPDYADPINPIHERLNQEQQASARRSPKMVDDQLTSHETNCFERKKEDKKSTDPTTGIGNGRSNSSEMLSIVQNVDTCESNISHKLPDDVSVMDICKTVPLYKDHEEGGNSRFCKQETGHGSQSLPENGLFLQSIEGLDETVSNSNKLVAQVTVEKMDTCSSFLSDPNRKHGETLVECPNAQNETSCSIRHEDPVDAKYSNPKNTGLSKNVSSVLCELKTSETNTAFSGDIDDDSVLKEAQIIEARRKRSVELSLRTSPERIQQRSHWDYVLEEMTWLANDFAQERMWKIAAAAQLCFKVSVACKLRREAKGSGMDAKTVARTLAKAVQEFWNSVLVKGASEITGQKSLRNEPIRAYAARVIISQNTSTPFCQTDLPVKHDRHSDLKSPEFREDNTTYEQNFYTVPPGAMETYRASVVSHVAHIEKTGSYGQEEAGMSAYDGVADLESQDIEYDENERENRAFDLTAGFESSIFSRHGRKKLKHLKHGRCMTPYEVGSDLSLQRYEIKLVNREPGSLSKRPGSSLNVSVPTKRVRTASRRVIGPFSAGPSGSSQMFNKADASSGDTSSLQDDLSTLRAGFFPNTLDTDSPRDFEKQSSYECAEVSMMPKKKKAKHMNNEYDQRWRADSSFHEEQRDRLKGRSENHLLESNGISGFFGQPMIKKSKVLRQSGDHSFENPSQPGVSVSSSAASQFSNMNNPNKLAKMLAGRDHGRKIKGQKMPTRQPGSGTPWSVFEDQALVVLVHDHGPNWELISDAFNSSLHFNCVFRTAKECKERHYTFMERNSCDGADSAEESGPSQPYPYTLPGIPKGSARQLFQRLLGPLEEDTLKSHFEKIITIGQKLLPRRNQDPKQLQQPHSSHSAALSQIFPNNLNGGPILTPLDLCDVPSPDAFSNGLQGVHNSGSGIPNQGVNNSSLPASGACSSLQGLPNMVSGTNFSSSPGTVNSPARHVIPRCGSFSTDDQKKIQHYNQMMPNRNASQASIPALGTLAGNDRGSRINASSGAVNVAANANRSFPMARPGLQGTSTPSVTTGHGSPMSRSHDPTQLMRPGMNQDSMRQIMMPDVHITGSSQGMSHQTNSSPVSSYTINHQASPQQHQAQHAYFEGTANHVPGSPQQPYISRLAKERQLPQRMKLQQPQPQQQFPASNTSMRHVQSKPQLPLPSPVQTSSQIQQQNSSPVAVSSLPQHQQKRQVAAVGVVQNPQGGGSVLANHTSKQQSRQHHLSQSNRQHPQRQQSQSVKLAKGVSIGGSDSNGVIASSGIQPLEKREAVTQFNQIQGLYTGSTPSIIQPARSCLANPSLNHSVHQKKPYSGQGTSAPRNIQTSKSDNGSQGNQSGPRVVSGSSLQRATSDGGLNSPTNGGSTISLPSNSYDSTPPDEQGLCQKQSVINHDVTEQWHQKQQQQQQQSQIQKTQSPIPQMPPSQSGQGPQQSQLLQAGNGNLYGRPSDQRLE